MIEIEVQNETHQDVHRIKAMCVPRIGEGIRLKEPNGQIGRASCRERVENSWCAVSLENK